MDTGAGIVQSGDGADDGFVVKYAGTTGSHIWTRAFANSSPNISYAVAADASSNVFLVGTFVSDLSIAGGPVLHSFSFQGSDVFVAKISATGAHVWSKAFGTTGSKRARGVAVDGSGNVVVVGDFMGAIDFGGGSFASASSATSDVFVAKLTGASGAHLWSKAAGGSGSDIAYGVTVDGGGNVLVAGSFQNTIDFGSGALTSAGGADMFVAKYAPAGTPTWSKRFGGTTEEAAYGVGTDLSNNVLLVGFMTGSMNLAGQTVSSAGSTDALLLRLAP
jgi:hypothetical protein